MAQGYILTKGAVQTFLNEVRQILNDKNSELRIYACHFILQNMK